MSSNQKKDLKKQFDLDFIIEMHRGISYIVLKEVNTKEIAEKISKLYLSRDTHNESKEPVLLLK